MQTLDAVFLTLFSLLVLLGRILAEGSRTTRSPDTDELPSSGLE